MLAWLLGVPVVCGSCAGLAAAGESVADCGLIYYWWVAKERISMLLVYAKNEMDDLTAQQLKLLKNQLKP